LFISISSLNILITIAIYVVPTCKSLAKCFLATLMLLL
jgi:hypothetical protein